ncbi:MAG TPA: SDR family NAD(P)-dependent oxidoreductase [Alphaproteobacteria bacterium]|nr:SDR family NAD(P)-dependent oxidoreductase [Alphaproteobacteria bacterium]
MNSKSVLITGAKGGLGTHVTETFLRAGAVVAGVSRSIKQADFPHPNFTAFSAELTDGASAAKVADAVRAKFGKIDVLIHLTGGFAGGKSVAETDDQTFEQMLDINLRSAFYILRSVIPHMRNAGSGRIVAIGSRAADGPAPGIGAYAAFKTALVSLVRTVASENKDLGITANVILPGTMDTPANRTSEPKADFSRWIQPQHVADLILWLSSEAAGQISGAVIPVYGRDV